MAIDGSFSVNSALERFLVRCPKLGRLPQFDNLVKKGRLVKEEEVVDVMAEVFLHPKYTIPLMGCFRPVAQNIVDKAVTLLHCVPNLKSNSDDTNALSREAQFLENSDLEEVFSVIEYHDQRGLGLNLHELACFAFCRALDLAPFLLGSIKTYFRFAPPPFERILMEGSATELLTEVVSHLLLGVRTTYRFLVMESEVFSKLWDWSGFLDLVKKLLELGEKSTISEDIADIRWVGIRIMSIILQTSTAANENSNFGSEEAFECLMRWDKFCQDVSLEKAGFYLRSSDDVTSSLICNNTVFNTEICLQSLGLSSASAVPNESESSSRGQRLKKWDDGLSRDPYILVSTVKRSFEMVLLAVSQKWPVLLYGPAGVGKSALIRKVARDTGNQVLSIHMDDQIDGKTLVGSYVCTERPGEFRWQPGSLTQAVLKGFWVVFENIDKAPPDVHSTLLPLLEGAGCFMTSHGEEIRVAQSFRLFSTISSPKLDMFHGKDGGNSFGSLWRRVMIIPPGVEDLRDIICAWYPDLEPLSGRLIETFYKVNSASFHQLVGCQPGLSASFGSAGRFTLRDLLKWSKRISCLGFNILGVSLSAYECRCIYQEAVDIFAAFSTSVENRLTIMKAIANIWEVPKSMAESLYPHDKPLIQDFLSETKIGRVTLQHFQAVSCEQKRPFIEIRGSMHLLERISCSVKCNEPVLLVGETGTGKTTLVQSLAGRLGQKLTVVNLSQQSDVADLLGGFKPMDAQFICFPLYKEFEGLFSKTISLKANGPFFARLQKHLIDKNWNKLLHGIQRGVDEIQRKGSVGKIREELEVGESNTNKKRKRIFKEVQEELEKFSAKLESARAQINGTSGMVFSFVEGAFLTALRNGDWILLDEVNLAPPETLQRILGVLEGENGSLCLAERGDVNYVHRHPNFRIFACMNPATDAGKRDLPYSLRSRFTEYFVDDVLDDEDLTLFVNQFVHERQSSNRELVKKIVNFYKAAKKDSDERLQDGANQKPQYSLRSLYRALEYTRNAERIFGFQKAIYDGFCMFFLTLLDGPSAKVMNHMILSCLLGGRSPVHISFDKYLQVENMPRSANFLENYVLTKSVKEHLTNLARAIFIKRYPVLLQGPTSSGKTSLVQYLAAITGHEFIRINNHEHTDLQEYLGSYITDASGKLEFQEGVLVKAVRNGYWIVLDELNLAPSDVLEALNRLLDDNRELFVPELCETVRAHPEFMLFATQNPPTFYGGRKMLSRAFRNRFVDIHVDEIPQEELSTILERRCEIPASRAKKMVEVMKELQLRRQRSKVFAGKHGFITPRDLFRWADRSRAFGNTYEGLAKDGYYLLAERLREEDEKSVVEEVLKEHLRVKIVKDDLYKQDLVSSDFALNLDGNAGALENIRNVICTKSMWRLYFLVRRCYELREPVLLVGETGGGKTTVCQLLSEVLGLKLHILNCHQYTETSDFLGGFYPIRERSRLMSEYTFEIKQLMLSKMFIRSSVDDRISPDISQASLTLGHLDNMFDSCKSFSDITEQDRIAFVKKKEKLAQLYQKWQTIFMWQDGPLVEAMKNGDLFLVDEISLADDSVLERLNSVLEPERKLSLAEKGGSTLERITAHPNFLVLATMNPGGDYGKKELSPALRNRFTEIWVPSVSDLDELQSIAIRRFSMREQSYIVDVMLNFWEWFNRLQTGRMLTVRDLLSWVDFINATGGSLGVELSFLHGVFLILLDGLTLGTGISKIDALNLRVKCFSYLLDRLQVANGSLDYLRLSRLESYGWGDIGATVELSCNDGIQSENIFGINPFYIEKGNENPGAVEFQFLAPTTCRNALRVLRAMQLSRPVLLEGSPGVGKTSLIIALGKSSGHRVVRINLSEQTDMMDLLGSDLPVESEEGMKFAWSDGILLQALKEGCWVLLDELNLAPQSVLEGLNAILDHRAEVFVPELGRTFKCPPSFRVFACQNPSQQGGGRKGLPKSFLNRFTKVYVDELVEDDYLFICTSLYPAIPRPLLSKLILFNKRMHEDTMLYQKFGQDGSPWEFNLRDVIRSCQIIQDSGALGALKVDSFLNVLYVQRMRTMADREKVMQLYEEVFEVKPYINPYPRVQVNKQNLIVGNAVIKRNYFQASKIKGNQLKILPGIRQSLEAVVHCLQHQWLCILVGHSASGKTSIVRLLSQLTGNILNELNLSAATDISELIGCFEQYNALRNLRSVVSQVENYVHEYCGAQLLSSRETFINERKNLITTWLRLLSSLECGLSSSSGSSQLEQCKSVFNSLGLLAEILEQLKFDLERNALAVSWSGEDLGRTMNMILKLQEDQCRISFSAKFEWVTGLLIKAIENGEWIVLENANLCNPTVLDRINSLVEMCGSITVSECGTVDGKPLVIHPHSNFRIFLTVNPSYGEVSRAMRNRGVEIFMMPPYWLFNNHIGEHFKDFELKDVKSFLVQSGIPAPTLVDAMAKAHVYAKDEGLHINVSITYLELARWVQLFQQLIVKGNQPTWSLLISWEHTYLSSLGEAEGVGIICHAKAAYLSKTEVYEPYSSWGHSMCLPGGWPMPLRLSDFIWQSTETCVKQNCIYLEYLGSQYALYKLETSKNRDLADQALANKVRSEPYLVDMKLLHNIVFPNNPKEIISNSVGMIEFDLDFANKMMFFAANWTMEQATLKDYKLYIQWLSWYGTRLSPYCQFFRNFVCSLEQEVDHPIWRYIFQYHKDLTSLYNVDLNLHPVPLLATESVDLSISDDQFLLSKQLFCNAVNCISLLRLSFQQWNAESGYAFGDENRCFMVVLKSLQALEKQVLDMLLEPSTFDVLSQLYANLLENHLQFWRSFTSSSNEQLLISWSYLKKNVTKLVEYCPAAAKTFLSENLGAVSSRLCLNKSLLWAHGGHPVLPRSAKLFHKQYQLLNLCELVWPTKTLSSEQVNGRPIEIAASSNPELRFLAVEGVCMSSHIVSNCDEDDVKAFQQLDEMYQMLLERFEHEKSKIDSHLRSSEPVPEANSATCCVVLPEAFCRASGFDGWQNSLPLVDSISFFLDLQLLEKLSSMCLVDKIDQDKHGLVMLLDSSLRFSLTFSSRPPQAFLPHQKILWALDAWVSVDEEPAKFASFVNEMWYRWHQALWNHIPVSIGHFSRISVHDLPPSMIMSPVRAATVNQILGTPKAVRDFSSHCLKIRVASSNLWQSSATDLEFQNFLFSSLCSLLQQIICAHRKSVDTCTFGRIKSILWSFQKRTATEDDVKQLCLLLILSSHDALRISVNLFIEHILRDLYHYCYSIDVHSCLGCAWLRIGMLRLHLLLSCGNVDPALKYSFKYSKLVEKISLLELEIKVRKDCEHLAGWFSNRAADRKRADLLEELEDRRKRLQKKVVFRPEQRKFRKLIKECQDFLRGHSEHTLSSLLNSDAEGLDFQQISKEVCNWQEKAACFIDRLSDEYTEYIDIVQPVQMAIYEMKLGSLLVLSSLSQKKLISTPLETIYYIMRFPRESLPEVTSVDFNRTPEFLYHGTECMRLLEKLSSVSSGSSPVDKMGSLLLKNRVGVHLDILIRVSHFISNAQLMDRASFLLLNRLFDEFASLWMTSKLMKKRKEDNDAQQYKFRPRVFKVDSVFDVGILSKHKSSEADGFSEWQKLFPDDELTDMNGGEDIETLDEEGDTLEEPALDTVVHIHNLLFGSIDLVQSLGTFQISDEDRLSSFIHSYALGIDMFKDMWGVCSSILDSKLIPEHLLRLYLENNQMLVNRSAQTYNFYKDPNASAMAKMVNLLSGLHWGICSLTEGEDHPLERIKDIAEMLLDIPLTAPLSKAFIGLQFLLTKIHMLQRDGAKFPLPGQLDPIIALLTSWQKIELDSWPALLEEVHKQYELNAGKLWFPLYGVLQLSNDRSNTQSTIQSLEEFIQSSSVGEFRRRLQLILAFLGQVNTRICLGTYSSQSQVENLRMILYNMFGFYVQFLPTILQYIEVNRKDIDKELKELQRLSRWERFDSYSSLENSRRSRQKLRKLIQKYTDMLQQPVLLVLDFEAAHKGVKVKSPLDPSVVHWNVKMLKELTKMEDRTEWCTNWLSRVTHEEGISGYIKQCFSTQSACLLYEKGWKQMWHTLEIISSHCDVLSTDENQSQLGRRLKEVKKRSLSQLFNQLKVCGLSRHKYEEQYESDRSSWWLLKPSYDVEHLLLAHDKLSRDAFVASLPTDVQNSVQGSLNAEWKIANEFYFKSMNSVQLLWQIALKFKKDFSSAQVKASMSFLNHLIEVQQDQRSAAYRFAENLRCLKRCISALEDIYSTSSAPNDETVSGCSLNEHQNSILNCMWQQKQIFDSLSLMLHEESLLLKAVDSTHLSTCRTVKAESRAALGSINKFIPIFEKSKESLDNYLLGCGGGITTVVEPLHPYVISRKMEDLVVSNFEVIEQLNTHVAAFRNQGVARNSVIETLLGHFDNAFNKSKLLQEKFRAIAEARIESAHPCEKTNCSTETAFETALEHVTEALRNLGSSNNFPAASEESLQKITSWESIFDSHVKKLGVQKLCEVLQSICHMRKLVGCSGSGFLCLPFHIRNHYKLLHTSLELILNFADGLLQDFLALHKTVTIMTHVLANVLSSLYYRGFGGEDQVSDDNCSSPQDASGTGMDEGTGVNDISNQISDEDQLLGASEKPGEDQNLSNEVPSKTDKGIEMEEDFAADTFSVSEDSAEEDGDDESEVGKLDSAMGETGQDSEVVDEKLWNKDEDDNPDKESEKNESGPSVKDRDPSCRELRAKDDCCAGDDENEELNSEELNRSEIQDDEGNTENVEDMNVDKEEAFADPTGLNIDEQNQGSEQDLEIDEEGREASMEDGGPEEHESGNDGKDEDEHDSSAEHEEFDEKTNATNEAMEGEEAAEVDGTSEGPDPTTESENADRSPMTQKNYATESQTSNMTCDDVPKATSEENTGTVAPSSGNLDTEVNWYNSRSNGDDFAPMNGLPSGNSCEVDLMVADPTDSGRFTDNQPKSQLLQNDSLTHQRTQPNPLRNVIDAIEEWKERAKVSADLQTDNMEVQDTAEEENADEYGYVSEFEKGTAQALGPATVEQTERNLDCYKPDGDNPAAGRDDPDKMDIDRQNSEAQPLGSSSAAFKNKVEDQMQSLGLDKFPDNGTPEVHVHGDGELGGLSESLVSVKRSYLSEDIHQFMRDDITNDKPVEACDVQEVSFDMKNDATTTWRKYELLTTRLSQELAEQLRLVLEPTLASKLQGDYKTGKRINMKKVIPYIASHYRKDKIWLRRTRPNKRDYQVVIAVDDSRSMSESGCGDVAIEALVTVCRAMSQLEMGNLAVASFGNKGNIRLLHDFDQPFTGEAGIKMISSLSFGQENTIADEPVVGLLKYLNSMLDAAVAKARLPSGQNPLEQLVLIIADGQFHEKKENIKRYVRELLTRRRMVAFLILDSPKESIIDLNSPQKSIMELMEISFEGGKFKSSSYLDSFPFPYYIILRNIEALPRTLADLLRQWFEVMQYSSE